jgi:hypothetical protein
MKQLIIIILLLQGTWLFAQEKSLVHKGNELYQQQNIKRPKPIIVNRLKKRKRTWKVILILATLYTNKRNLKMPVSNLTSLPRRRKTKL